MIEAFGFGSKEGSDPLFWLIAPFISAYDTKSTQYQLVIKASERIAEKNCRVANAESIIFDYITFIRREPEEVPCEPVRS